MIVAKPPYTGERLAPETALYWRPPAGVRRAFADGRYGQMHYRLVKPEGVAKHVPLVFFHQSPSSGRAFEGLLAQLGKDRLVLAPDTPGFGDSDPPPGPPSIADYAAAMGDFLDAMQLGEVDLFGDHTGAKIAVELAQQRPSQIRRLILNACPVYSDEEMRAMQATLADEKPQDRPDDGSHLLHQWSSMRSTYAPDTPLAQFDRDFTETLRAGERGWYGYNAAFAYSHAENLPNVRQPIMVLCTDDGLWPATQRARSYLRNGHILERPDLKTGAVSFHTEAMADLLRNFLDTADKTANPAVPKAAPARPTVPMRAIRRRFVDTPQGQMHVRVADGGTVAQLPLYCFHMSPRSTLYLEPLIAALGVTRTVIAVDAPGYGESYKPATRPEIADHVAAMTAVMDALGHRQVDILGDHTGTKTAIELTRLNPQRVRRIVMNTAGVYSPAEQEAFRTRMDDIPVREDGSHLAGIWQRFHQQNRGSLTEAQIRLRTYESFRAGPCIWWGPRAANVYSYADVFPTLEQPILLLCSAQANLIEPTRRAAKRLRHGRYVELPDMGKTLFEERADVVAPLIDAFLTAENPLSDAR